MTQIFTRTACCVAAILCIAAAGAHAETMTLRLADSLPSGHIIHKVLTKPFMEEVEKASKGEIKLQHFPGEQLGKAKDLLALTQSGVVDIGYVAPAYQSDKMPLSDVFELPGGFSDYCQANRALWAMTHDGGFLEKKEFAPNRVIPLITFVLPAYNIMIGSGKNVQSVKDLAGLKIRSTGGAMDFMARSLNIVPVRLAAPEIYESMSRGTIDGAFLPYLSAASYGIDNLLKSGSTDQNFGATVLTYTIGENKWKRLSEPMRAILMEAGKRVSMAACTKFQAAENDSVSKVKTHGMKVINFNAADRKVLQSEFEHIKNDWAASLDKRGKPGTEAANAFIKALAQPN